MAAALNAEFLGIFQALEAVHAKAGQVVFRKGDLGRSMYFIELGSVRVWGSPRERGVLPAGHVFGEPALFHVAHHRAATVSALTDCVFRVLTHESLEALKKSQLELVCGFLAHTCAYLLESEQRLNVELAARNRELERTLDYLRRTREELDSADALARVDGMTGLYNRRFLDEQLPRLIERAEAGSPGLALCFMDLDHLKAINDTHGHQAGDAVICHLAESIKSRARKPDLPCRVGGDEFVVALDAVQEPDARAWAVEAFHAVSASNVEIPEASLSITVSMGGCVWRKGERMEALLARADGFLYQAKQNGRNRLGWMGELIVPPAGPPDSPVMGASSGGGRP